MLSKTPSTVIVWPPETRITLPLNAKPVTAMLLPLSSSEPPPLPSAAAVPGARVLDPAVRSVMDSRCTAVCFAVTEKFLTGDE